MHSPQYSTPKSDQSVGLEQDNQHQQQAVKQQMDLRKHRYQLLFHDCNDCRAQYRAPNRANSADNGHQQDSYAGAECKYSLRMDVCSVVGKHAAGDSGEGRGDGMDPQYAAKRINTDIRGGVFILTNGA